MSYSDNELKTDEQIPRIIPNAFAWRDHDQTTGPGRPLNRLTTIQ
jgi:hypothetical protein